LEFDLKVLVSPEDEEILASYQWHQASTGYIRRLDRASSPARLIGLHRQIMGDPKGMVVDHINGDPSDNRRENLRVCSQEENTRNRGHSKHNKIGIKGVFVHRGRYRAQIRVKGRRIHLGDFDTPELAQSAYATAAIKHHGEFARIK